MPHILKLTRFGNPILRQKSRRLTKSEIKSPKIQQLIQDIRYTNKIKEYGVGLAAPQVGEPVALSVIGIKPTPNRPDRNPFDSVIINPKYKGLGRVKPSWEGCQSCGSGNDILFAQVPRYPKIQAEWQDETGQMHSEVLSDFIAQAFQHETDHLNGILFVDKVVDPKTFMMADEYRQRIVNQNK